MLLSILSTAARMLNRCCWMLQRLLHTASSVLVAASSVLAATTCTSRSIRTFALQRIAEATAPRHNAGKRMSLVDAGREQ